VAIAAK